MFNFTGTEACLIAALSLSTPPLSDLARLSCRLFTLERLTLLDAAPFDPLATACATPTTLIDSTDCSSLDRSLPERIDGQNVYALYNASVASAFFETQTAVQLDAHCSGTPNFFGTFGASSSDLFDPELCSCTDILALKTLGSPRRAAILEEHERRAAAASELRANRITELSLVKRLHQYILDTLV